MSGAPIFAPTPEQAGAADPSCSVWVTANAGTGKTRVLSDRVLRLLLAGVDPETILCITFTKAAAAEMTERIEKTLARWAVERYEERLALELADLTGSEAQKPLLHAARRLFANVLDLPQGLQVMTIHSFCHSLLKRFPLEADLVPHFEVIDDRTATELMREAREQLLQRALVEAGERREALDILSRALPEQALGEFFDEILSARTRIAKVLAPLSNAADLRAELERRLATDLTAAPNDLIQKACVDGEYDAQGLSHAANVLTASASARDQTRGRAIATWINLSETDRVRVFDDYRRDLLAYTGGNPEKLATKPVRTTNPEIMAALAREQARLVHLDQALSGMIVGRHTLAALTIARFLLTAYENAKRRKGTLDYDDLIEHASALLEDPDRRAWVLYKLDARLNHILVDEAQDTSPAQWQIVSSLTEEFFAGEGSRPAGRTLFVVGDEKQSIYSFQGADLANFQNVHHRLSERALHAQLPFREVELATSFRSTGSILEVVDKVIAQPAFEASLGRPNVKIEHISNRRNEPGLVELWPLFPPTKKDEENEPWSLPGERRHSQGPEEKLAHHIARQIKIWLQDETALAKTKKPPRPGDILILVSRRGLIQELVIRALKREAIPVAGADRLRLGEHIAVKDLIALGAAVLLPDDELTLACLLKSPLVGLDEQALFDLCWNREKGLLAQLRDAAGRDPERYGMAARRVMTWLSRADFSPPYEFFTGILADGGRERMLARLGPDAAEPMEAFLEQALLYEQGHPASLQGFLHWLTLEDQQLKRDPEPASDEVRVMTVHGAKGLEAPIVILADAGPRSSKRSNRLVFDQDGWPFWRAAQDQRDAITDVLVEREKARDADERLRLLYVAMTRAQDRLYVAGWQKRKDTNESWHQLVEGAMRELDGVMEVPFSLGSEQLAPALRYARGQAVDVETIVESAVPPRASLPAWADRIAPQEPEKPAIVSPSRFIDDEPPSLSPRTLKSRTGRSFGIEVHRLLHILATVAIDERASVLDRLLQQPASTSDPATQAEIKRQVLSVLQLAELAPAFAPGSRSEQAIIGRIGDVQIAGQIDRFAVTETSLFMVDFKTGRPPRPDLGAVPKGYLRQLGAYASLLTRIYPGRTVKAGLVWTAVPVLVGIPERRLEPFLLADNSAGRP